jgi:nicotinamidase-related amidase
MTAREIGSVSESALLVMDCQVDIVERYAAGPCLNVVSRALAAARRAGIPVFYVQVAFREGYPEVSPRNRSFMRAREGEWFLADRPGTAIHRAIAPQSQDVVVVKHRVSAFYGTDLDQVLRARGILRLILTGIATSGVVLSTLRDAADRDYEATVLSDCCQDAEPEVHRVLTEKVFRDQARVVASAEWIAEIETLADASATSGG